MNRLVKSIFVYMANKLGMDIVDKTEHSNDFFETNTISITASMSERISTITLMGSSINVEGTNQRALFIEKIARDIFQNHLKNACTFALGTGTALIKPNTDGRRFGFDIISEDDYVITSHVGNYIDGVLIKVGEYATRGKRFTLIESQELKEIENIMCCEIKYMAFMDDKEIELKKTKWSDYEDYILPNVKNLLFGRIKCPTTNRKDINSPNGVSVTFGMNEPVENAKDSYRRYNKEFNDKETMVFADKAIFKSDDGKKGLRMPKGKERLFLKLRNNNMDQTLIDTYSPEIREGALDSGIERNFRMLELLSGLGEGILSKSTVTYQNMDEVRAMKQATYAFMNSFRKSIDECLEEVLYAVDVIANYNNITVMGEYTAYIDWSDEYMTSVSERFNQYVQADSMGWIEEAEGRALLLNEDIDEARENIAVIKEGRVEEKIPVS